MSTPEAPAPSMLPVGGLGCLLSVVGMFVFTVAWSSTCEFWDLGAARFFIFGLPLMLLTLLGVSAILLATSWILVRSRFSTRTQRLLLLSPWVLAAVLWLTYAVLSASPRSRFESVVVGPIPASVRDIRAAGFNSFLASRWLVRFTVEPQDLQGIVARCELTETEPFDFAAVVQRDGNLRRVDWASHIPETSDGRFFSRREEHGDAVSMILLVYDKATSQAWFLRSYQN